MKEHLNLDTDFLNNVQASSQTKSEPSVNHVGKKSNWTRNCLIIVGILFVGYILIIASEESGSSNTNTTNTQASRNNNSLTFDGQTFICSDYHYNRAIALQPDAALRARLDAESTALDIRIDAIEVQSRRIDNMYVDKYSQSSVNAYNAAVDSFNSRNNQLKFDIDSWNKRNDDFNAKIDVYNNYLKVNCRPR